jgi:diguanylate cyclase (GGDEF)-like protein
VCDVDDLKRVNDEDGHDAGDKVITAVADALSSAVARLPRAVCVRLGGDEFAVLLPGSQRATAIGTVESAARALAGHTPPVTISCGIAAVPAGASVRDALSVADAAQYSAKRRGALLFVAGAESGDEAPRRRFRDRRRDGQPQGAPSADMQQAAARAIVALGHDLVDAPDTPRERLVWLAERLLAGFELDHWSLSTVDLAGDRLLTVTSMGLRSGRPLGEADADLLVDAALPLSDYPVSERAVLGGGWFTVDSHDNLADPAERAVLTSLGKRYVVAIGWALDGHGLLLEMYGCGTRDVELLGATAALATGALLGQPLHRVASPTPAAS